MRTYEEKIKLVKDALPGGQSEVAKKVPEMSRGTVVDTLRRMEGLGLCKVRDLSRSRKLYYL